MLILLLLVAALAAPAQSSDFSKLIPAADVEKVTGLKGVTVMPTPAQNEKMLGGLMFMSNQRLVMMINFAKPGTFVMDKRRPVAGVADEAFDSPDRSVLCFRKGDRPVMVQSGYDGARKPMWSPEQLKTVAKLIYSRM